MKRKLFFLCAVLTTGALTLNVKDNVSTETLTFSSNVSTKFDKPIYFEVTETEYCANCGAPNEVDAVRGSKFVICKECGQFINGVVSMPYAKTVECVNCGEENFLLFLNPKFGNAESTTCRKCGNDIYVKILKQTIKCMNCPESTFDDGDPNQICPSCNYYLKRKVMPCIDPSCEGWVVIENEDSYNNPCPICNKPIYTIENCIRCDAENRAFRKGCYHYNDKCVSCGGFWDHSTYFTGIYFDLKYCITYLVDDSYYSTDSCPLYGLRVVLMSDFRQIDEGVTDKNGSVRFTCYYNELGTSITLKIFAGDNDINVYNPADGKKRYYQETFSTYNITPNVINRFSFEYRDDESVNIKSRSLLLGSTAVMVKEFAWEMMGEKPDNVKVVFPSNQNNNSCYSSRLKTIYITKGNSSIDTLFHEYGHHIANLKGISNSIAGEHDFLTANEGREIVYNGVSTHKNYTLKEAKELAWSEGWATAFEEVAENYFYHEKNLHMIDYFNFANMTHNGLNLEYYAYPTLYGDITDDCEGMVAAVLWDLFDKYNFRDYQYDDISLSYIEWFDKTTRNNVTTFEEFYNDFISNEGPNSFNAVCLEDIMFSWLIKH